MNLFYGRHQTRTFAGGVAILVLGVLQSCVCFGAVPTTYNGFDSFKPSMPLMLNANRHLVVVREAPVCKFTIAAKHPLGRVSVAQRIEALIREGKKDEAIDLIDQSVTDGTCSMSKEGDQVHVTGMLMASDCNGEHESRVNVEAGEGVFDACFYVPIVKVKDVEYATLAVSLRGFENYAIIYLRTALLRKGLAPSI